MNGLLHILTQVAANSNCILIKAIKFVVGPTCLPGRNLVIGAALPRYNPCYREGVVDGVRFETWGKKDMGLEKLKITHKTSFKK